MPYYIPYNNIGIIFCHLTISTISISHTDDNNKHVNRLQRPYQQMPNKLPLGPHILKEKKIIHPIKGTKHHIKPNIFYIKSYNWSGHVELGGSRVY